MIPVSPSRWLGVCSAALLAACSMSPAHVSLNAADHDYAVNLSTYVQADRALVRHEIARTQDPRMAELAHHLGSQSDALARQLAPIVRRASIQVAANDPDAAAKGSTATYLGENILVTANITPDKAFLAQEVSLQGQALSQIRENALAHGRNPELRFLSRDVLQPVAWNLKLLRNAQTQKLASID